MRYMPTVLVVDFIRTAMGVGKGDITPFNYSTNFFIDTNYTNPSRAEFTIEGYNLRATLEHNAFFTTCSTQKSTIDVNMGRPTAYDIKEGLCQIMAFHWMLCAKDSIRVSNLL